MGTKTRQFLFFDTLLSLASQGHQSIMLIKLIANFHEKTQRLHWVSLYYSVYSTH